MRDWAHHAQLVTSTTIENAVKTLMTTKEGHDMKKRAAELGNAVRGSLAKDGAARLEMDSFIAHITRCYNRFRVHYCLFLIFLVFLRKRRKKIEYTHKRIYITQHNVDTI